MTYRALNKPCARCGTLLIEAGYISGEGELCEGCHKRGVATEALTLGEQVRGREATMRAVLSTCCAIFCAVILVLMHVLEWVPIRIIALVMLVSGSTVYQALRSERDWRRAQERGAQERGRAVIITFCAAGACMLLTVFGFFAFAGGPVSHSL
jgi:hypothetical protein